MVCSAYIHAFECNAFVFLDDIRFSESRQPVLHFWSRYSGGLGIIISWAGLKHRLIDALNVRVSLTINSSSLKGSWK